MSVHGPLGATQGGAFELGTSALDARPIVSHSRLGLLALTGLVLTGLLISVSAAGTETLLPESVRPLPRWLAGPFGTPGIELHPGELIGVLALMFACYALAVREADRLTAPMVLTAIAAVHALVLLAPPMLSTDAFSYQFYGRMGALYGANPYLAGPHALALDPLYPYIGAKWTYTPTVYGPVFTAFSYVLAPLSIAASALSYKLVAALASLSTVALVWNGARLRGVNPVAAAALVGLNPLVVLYGVGGGHNDLLMIVLLVAGLVLMLQHRLLAGAASMTVAAAVKLTGGFLLPFALADSSGPSAKRSRRDILTGAAVAGVIVAVLGLAAFGPGMLHLFGTLRQVQSEGDWHSIPGFVATELRLNAIGHVVAVVLALWFAWYYCKLVWRVRRGELDWVAAAGWAAVAMLISAASLLPWYVVWLMPLAALGGDRRLWRAAILVTGIVQFLQLVGYIPHINHLLGI